MILNDKQQYVYDKLLKIFGNVVLEKEEILKQYIVNDAQLDFIEVTNEYLNDKYNDVLYPRTENLFKKYILPPFSVLDTKSAKWLNRRELLDEYFGDSLIGRSAGLTYSNWIEREKTKSNKKDFIVKMVRKDDNGSSKFDSVLCEILLKWFGFPKCKVYDCFAGGHIRGAMAVKLGYDYLGIDLATEQIEANFIQAEKLGLKVNWINDDSLNVDRYLEDNSIDLFFSCPPYGDLEKYTDNPRDLSNMSYQGFINIYEQIIQKGCNKLKQDRFAVFVVGDFRDKQSFYRGFIKDTIIAFEKAGMKLYNEIILLNALSTASIRASNTFNNRKMVKVHQNILVFYKGDSKNIQRIYGKVDSSLPIITKNQSNLFNINL